MLLEEIMIRDVVTLSSTHTVQDALMIMQEHKIRHLPLTNEDGGLEGIVTDRDLKDASPSTMLKGEHDSLLTIPLSEIMTKYPITAHPMDFVEEAAVILYRNQVGCLPIISNQKLVGIITETDLLYTFIELTGANQPGSQIEVRVPDTPGILFEVSQVFYEFKTNVQSVLVYPDKENPANKILVFRIKTMNPLSIISGLREKGFDVLWPNVPGIDQ